FSDGINIRQSPPSLIKSPGHSVELQCSHDDSNYNQMYWYQQTRKGALDLIGYLSNTEVKPEEKFKERFILTGDGRKAGSLTISSVTAEDSAVYFCAASTVLQ
ncbi:HVM14 protein, partial [Polyodon spathula]|nr:HVM14 protein [Polyodon spathula]